MEEKIYIGCDTATTGALAITQGDKILKVLKYPEPQLNSKRLKEIAKELKELKNEEHNKTKIKELKAERKLINRRAIRDFKAIYDFLLPYKNENVTIIIEEPLRQVSFGSTSADTLCSTHIVIGVYLAIFAILEMKYELVSPRGWHEQFNYKFKKGIKQKERREEIKKQSIKFSKQMFKNTDDFLIKKGCRKEDDNIAESAILSRVNYLKENNIKFGE